MLPSLDNFNKPIRYLYIGQIIYHILSYSLHYSHLFVVVTSNKNVIPTQVPDDNLVGHSGSVNMMYVAAVVQNLSGDQWEKKIVIGDKSNYTHDNSIYYNAPLDKDLSYYIFVRAYAYSHNESVSLPIKMNNILCCDIILQHPKYASSGLSEPIGKCVNSFTCTVLWPHCFSIIYQ